MVTAPALLESERLAADAVGDVIEYWGFRKALGRVWTVLYLSGAPLPAAELGERLSMSAGAVSTALTELQRWGVVRRVWLPGERREFFEAETDLWRMISKVINERERHLASGVKARLGDARALLARAPRTRETKARDDRMRNLVALATIGEKLIEALVTKGVADFATFGSFLRRTAPPQKPRSIPR